MNMLLFDLLLDSVAVAPSLEENEPVAVAPSLEENEPVAAAVASA